MANETLKFTGALGVDSGTLDAAVTADNLSSLVDGSDASSLHSHATSSVTGTLTLNGTTGVNLQGNGTTAVAVNSTGTAITVQAGATLATTGSGTINLPNNGSARFNVEGVAVSANVTAANLTALTGAGSTALHTHNGVDVTGLTTSDLTSGLCGYFSTANTLSKTDSATEAKVQLAGVYTGTSGQIRVAGIVPAVAFTTAGGSPAVGALVYLAAATDDTNTGAGKMTATEPGSGYIAEVGICVDPANYAGAKTAVVLLKPKSVVPA